MHKTAGPESTGSIGAERAWRSEAVDRRPGQKSEPACAGRRIMEGGEAVAALTGTIIILLGDAFVLVGGPVFKTGAAS